MLTAPTSLWMVATMSAPVEALAMVSPEETLAMLAAPMVSEVLLMFLKTCL